MVRRMTQGLIVLAIVAVAFVVTTPTAAPIRLARHPDYHAGKIAFSYLGDIWTANEDGSNTRRLTDHRAREVYPRFSPDGRHSPSRRTATATMTFSLSRRAAAPEAAHLSHRDGRRGRLDARLAERPLPLGARRRRLSNGRDHVRSAGGRRPGETAAGRLGILGQLLAGRHVTRLQPASLVLVATALPRQLRRRPLGGRSLEQVLHAAAR